MEKQSVNDQLCYSYNDTINRIPRRITPAVTTRDLNNENSWEKVRIYKVAKFDLSKQEEIAHYCSIMSNAANGRFRIVNLNRTFLTLEDTTKVIVDLEYYEQEYNKKVDKYGR